MAMKKMMMVMTMGVFVTVQFLSASHALEITYTYDALNRITAAAYQSNSKTTTLSYQYDAAGNRTAYTVTGAESGTVTINAQPDAMNTAAPWILTDPNNHSQSGTGDQTLSNSPIGNYMIIWGDVPGWIKPSPDAETKALTSGATITFSGTYVQLPAIQVTQSILNFGYVPPGSSKDLILVVKNIGGGILTGTVSSPCPAFSIILGGSYGLVAGESQQVIVRYMAPLEEGSQTCSFIFTGGGGITIQVKGTNQNVGLPWLLLLLGN